MAGYLIVSYDDGFTTDYTKAFPIHKKWNVPAETCIISSWVGKHEFLDAGQLHEMQNNGWEIVSHTKNHSILVGEPLIKSALCGDKYIYIDNTSRFFLNTKCVIAKGKLKEAIMILDTLKDGTILELYEGLKNNYLASGIKMVLYKYLRYFTRKIGIYEKINNDIIDKVLNIPVIKINSEQAIEEISGSKKELQDYGFRINNFSCPHNVFDLRFSDILASHYRTVRVQGNRLNKIRKKRLPFLIHSYDFNGHKTDHFTRIFNLMNSNNLCVINAHTYNNDFSEERIDNLVRMAKAHKVEIMTRVKLLTNI